MIRGPAKVIVTGRCHVLGKDVSNQQVTVREGKAFPFEPDEGCKIEVEFENDDATSWMADPENAGVSMWHRVVQTIISIKARTVMIVGDSDSGKSTFATYLANVALANDLEPFVIDADIGQGDLAPPTAIGGVLVREPIVELRDLEPEMFEFVGNTTPTAGFDSLVIKGILSILKNVRRQSNTICIVNTDGYVTDAGIDYKIKMTRDLKADIMICLGCQPSVIKAFKDDLKSTILHALSSDQTTKSRSDRFKRRIAQYNRFTKGGRLHSRQLKRVKFVYQCRTLPAYKFFASLSRRHILKKDIIGMFVGVGSRKRVIGFGNVKRVTAAGIFIESPVASFDTIYPSNVRLNMDRTREQRIF